VTPHPNPPRTGGGGAAAYESNWKSNRACCFVHLRDFCGKQLHHQGHKEPRRGAASRERRPQTGRDPRRRRRGLLTPDGRRRGGRREGGAGGSRSFFNSPSMVCIAHERRTRPMSSQEIGRKLAAIL